MRQTLFLLFCAALVAMLAAESAFAQDKAEERVKALDSRVSQLESAVDHKAGIGGILFLYGIFCALWAQNSGRSAWLWFFTGLMFSVITGIVLLVKNADDRKRRRLHDFVPNQPG
jgi:hypothetical protein